MKRTNGTRASGSRRLGLAGLVLSLGLMGPPLLITIHEHVGTNDPLTEDFGFWPFNGTLATLAIPDDGGVATWQLTNLGGSPQAVYIQLGGIGGYLGGSGLTQAEIDDLQTNGFTLSLRARVVSGPVYDELGSQAFSGMVSLAGISGYRYDIELGLDGAGNTVVVLPQNVYFAGGVFGADPAGSTLLVPGNGYHLYQLSYDPVSATAHLLIDGVVRVSGYVGGTAGGGVVSDNYGLAFGAFNFATVNFADCRLQSGQIVAAAAARNGGSNPMSYSASPPVIGAHWTAAVDLSLTGHTTAQVLGYAQPEDLTLPAGQVLLVGGPRLFKLPAKSAPASWSAPIPPEPTLVGRRLYTQGVHLFGVTPYELTNAQDLIVGY